MMYYSGIIDFVIGSYKRYLSDTWCSNTASTMFVTLCKWAHIDGCLQRQFCYFISEYVEHVSYLQRGN